MSSKFNKLEQQNQRINAMLQQYEIERRSMLNQQYQESVKPASSAGVKCNNEQMVIRHLPDGQPDYF